MQSKYSDDPDFALQLRHITALAYLPPQSIEEAYDELVATEFFDSETNPHHEAIDKLLEYFQKTYVKDFDRRGNRKDPLFPPQLWSVYDVMLSGIYSNMNSKKFSDGFLYAHVLYLSEFVEDFCQIFIRSLSLAVEKELYISLNDFTNFLDNFRIFLDGFLMKLYYLFV